MPKKHANQLVVPGVEETINRTKAEIAGEFHVKLGPDSTSRSNDSSGEDVTNKLIQSAHEQSGDA